MTNPASPRREWRDRNRSDAELVQATREGDRLAFATLWQRHAEAARRAARAVSWSMDPDDLVSEAFTRILRATQRGGGPTEAFRPYLFVTIKNVAVSWSKEPRAVALDESFDLADEQHPDPATLVADRTSLARAFRSLPERWRSVLWYVEVEGMTPRELAPILGMSANSVAALVYRAREGFRKAWMEAHIDEPDRSEECRWSTELVVARRGKRVRKVDEKRLDRHLADCAACRILAADDREPVQRLRAVLVVSTLGTAAAAYSQLHSPAPAAAAVGKPPVVAPAALVAASVGLVLVVGGAVAALTSGPFAPGGSSVVAEATTEPSVAVPAPAPSATPESAPPAEPRTTPAPAPAEPPPASPPVADPGPPSTPIVQPSVTPGESPAPLPSPAPAPTPAPTPTPTPTPTPQTAPAPGVDVPADLAAPVPAPITGTGIAGAVIVAQDPAGRILGTAAVGDDATFALDLDTALADEGATVRLIQRIGGWTDSRPSPEIGPYLLPRPQLTGPDGTTDVTRADLDGDGDADDVELLLSGIAGEHLVVSLDGLPTGRVHPLEEEPISRYVPDLGLGVHTFTVRYSDPEGTRFGRPLQVDIAVVEPDDAPDIGDEIE